MSKNIKTVEDITLRNLSECIPYEDNPRHNEKAVDAVAASIEEFGFNIPIILDENDVIVTGHTRRLAAKKLGMKKVPTISASHLTEDQIRAFRLADNRVAENATWDDEALAREMMLLDASGFALEITGFSKEEIDCLTMEVDASCLSDLTTENVCGEIEDAKAGVVASKRIGVSVGGYRLFISKDEYQQWEKAQLAKHGSKADVVRGIAKSLGFTEAEFDEKS